MVARYVLGILHAQKFFDRVRPLNFTTFASPAIGMPLFDSWISRATARLGSRLMGRTGAQLFNADDERLIWRLADPSACAPFHPLLRLDCADDSRQDRSSCVLSSSFLA